MSRPFAATPSASAPPAASAAGNPCPERIGVYKVAGFIGEGGMGAVYRGERCDGLFEQTVAIKLIRPGALSQKAAELFAAERRILARLEHPHIAQLLDGGVMESGASYIVMEYLDGAPITQFVLEKALLPQQRLALFRSACLAVQHAHQHLVAHGDIKPSNIMVTRAGIVKLLDFGIARLLDASSPAGDEQPLPFTRAYSSPERARGTPPTAASDIRSLGMVLHELLVGTRPCKAGVAAQLDGDLRAIFAKATRPLREQRYASVTELIDDLDRYRESRPVHARPATWRYVTSRMIARYRWMFTAATAVLAMMIAGGILASVLYLRAERLRAQANLRFDDVRHMANFMLFDLYDQMGRVPGSVQVRRELADRGRSYLQTLAAIPGASPDVTLEAAEGYARLGEVLGAPGSFHLGQTPAAKANLAIAKRMLEAMRAQQPARNDIAVALAQVLQLQASIASSVDLDAPEAIRLAESARRLCEAVLARDKGNTAALIGRWRSRNTMANALGWQNRMPEVAAMMREVLAGAPSIPIGSPYGVQRLMLEANSRNSLGDALYYMDDLPGSLKSYQEAAAIIEGARVHESRLVPPRGDDPRYLEQLGLIYWNTGGLLSDMNRDIEADDALARSTRMLERSIDYGSNDRTERLLQSARLQHALVLSKLGRFPRAIELGLASIANREERLAGQPGDRERHRDLAVSLRPLGDVYDAAKQHDDACAMYTRAGEAWQAIDDAWGIAQFDRDVELKLVNERLQKVCPETP